MKPAVEDLPPVRVFATPGLKRLTRQRIEELRAKGVRYEVIELDGVLAQDCGRK